MLYTDSNAALKKNKKKNSKPSDGYIEKFDFKGQPTVVIREFEPEVFKQLITYTHTGSVVLQARTLLGLMNAADHYGLEGLKQACIRFMEHCVTIDTVCSLLTSAEKYIQYKSTKILVQKMLEFVDMNAESILSLGAFSTLPQHVVRIVLSREELQAPETKKFEAAYRWCLHYNDDHPDVSIKNAFEPFVDVIDFCLIPANSLMKNVKPAAVVDDGVILTALAYQADPKSVDHIRPHSSASVSKPHPRSAVSPNFRRVQSSGIPLNTESVDYGERRTRSTASRTVRGGSVPPPLHSMGSQDMLHLRGDSHPMRIHGARDRIESRSSSHLSTPPMSPSLDSYHGSSTLSSASSYDQDHHGNDICSPGNGASLSQPLLFENGQTRQPLTYNPRALDTIVTMSSTNAVEV